jgi:CRP/FNR family cyclic AMP-dependent transcriptional regulator
MEDLERVLSEHPFFATFPQEHRHLLAGCAMNHRFNAGQFLFHECDPANEFFLIRRGKIALEIVAPGKAPIIFETLQDGEIVGASWLVSLSADVRCTGRCIDPCNQHGRRLSSREVRGRS